MNTLKKMLVALPLVVSTLTGCAVLEATGEIAMGAVQLVGETALFVTDTVTFGAVSSLTGLDDQPWASTPSQAASTYVAASSAYSSASGLAPSSGAPSGSAATLGPVGGGNTSKNYDCESREKELMARMQRISGRDSGSICLTARASAPLFEEVAEFYRNCRVLDPTGELARTAAENGRNMRETARQVCTN